MKNILMIPTISDVSTVEEWRVVAKDIVGRKGELGYRVTIVDWPGLGYSDRPSLNYNADVMESFLVELMNSPNSPVANAGKPDCSFFSGLFTQSMHFTFALDFGFLPCPHMFTVSQPHPQQNKDVCIRVHAVQWFNQQYYVCAEGFLWSRIHNSICSQLKCKRHIF